VVDRDRNRSYSKKIKKRTKQKENERTERKRRSYEDVKAVYVTALMQFMGTNRLARREHVIINHLRRIVKKRGRKRKGRENSKQSICRLC
jgi:transposase-like protein